MNFNELKDELFARGTNYLEEDAETEARAERWLNQAYREILNLQAWPFLETDSVGAVPRSIPDVRRVLFVVTDTFVPLQYTLYADLQREGLDVNLTGDPERWYLLAGTHIWTYPIYSGSLNVRYLRRVAPLTGTDEPVFDEEYHNLIVDKAMIKAYIDSDNFEAAAALREEFNTGAAAMAEDYFLDSRELTFIPITPYDG